MRAGLTVYEQRSTLERQLKRSLDREFVVATNPDHPLLMKGPDILVGGMGQFSAVLIPTKEEVAQPWQLMGRFTLSRLALPRHARFFLLVDRDSEKLANSLERDVTETFRWKDRHELSVVTNGPTDIPYRELPKEIQFEAWRRFSETYRASRLARAGVLERADRMASSSSQRAIGLLSETSSANIQTYRRRSPGSIEYYGDSMIPAVRLRKRRSKYQEIANLTRGEIDNFYRLDSGIPIPTNEPSGVALIEDIPEAPGDPDLVLRSAAFGGWSLIKEKDLNSMAAVTRFISTRVTSYE